MENTQVETTSYDELRYYSKPFSFTSIALLEGNAYLWGLTPPAIKGAKVLELGSSFGGNLISQAVYYPETEFVGIDLSNSQITQGNEIIKSMGLKNIRLEARNILDITPEFGKFDYIIVHGIYSWVPDEVKSKILDVCRDNLSENGIAYISYNTYPGWKSREVVRDIMLFTNKHTADLPLAERTRRGKAVVKLFSDAIKTIEPEKESNKLRVESFDFILDQDEHYVAHEYLEYYNHPLYLNEFVDSVHQHNLAYIGDTDFQLSFTSWMPQHIRETIVNLANDDYVAREQCLDYIYDVAFRRSLLCHANLQESINRTEEISKSKLDELTFINTNKENNISSLFNDDKISNLLEYFIFNVGKFTIKDIKKYVGSHKELQSVSEDFIYSSVLLVIILNYVNVYLTPYKIHVFEDNKNYIPERFVNYMKTMLEDANQYIALGDMYNRNIEYGLGELSLYVMSQMSKPTTRSNIETSLKTFLIENGYKDNEKPIDEDYDVTSLCQAIIHNLNNAGYVQPALIKETKSELKTNLDVNSNTKTKKKVETKIKPKKKNKK